MDFSDLNNITEIRARFEPFFGALAARYQKLCLSALALGIAALYSIGYCFYKQIFIPSGFFCLGVLLYFFIGRRRIKEELAQAVTAYKKRIQEIRAAGDLEVKASLYHNLTDYDDLSLVQKPNLLLLRCACVITAFALVLIPYDSQKKFHADRWEKGGTNRLVMAEDFLHIQRDNVRSSDGYLGRMSASQIDTLFNEKSGKTPNEDITVINADKDGSYHSTVYFVCTTSFGIHYWIVIYYQDYGLETQSVKNVLLARTGQTVHPNNDSHTFCRLWF